MVIYGHPSNLRKKILLSPPVLKCAIEGKLRPKAYKHKQKKKTNKRRKRNAKPLLTIKQYPDFEGVKKAYFVFSEYVSTSTKQ